MWVKGALTPQEIRDRLEDKYGPFQKALIEYLESCHTGAFLASDPTSIAESASCTRADGFKDATYALPKPPPNVCDTGCSECDECECHSQWLEEFDGEV